MRNGITLLVAQSSHLWLDRRDGYKHGGDPIQIKKQRAHTPEVSDDVESLDWKS